MTAEVAILNREAVAIAADSAVTLTGPEGRKIYNTANKLFALSATEPVAVMVYGAGSFGSIPWETVIKEYRRENGMTLYATVEEYASHFIAYLSSLAKLISIENQYNQITTTAKMEFHMAESQVQDAIKEAASNGRTLKDSEIREIILIHIKTRIENLKLMPIIEGLSASVAGRQINAAIDDWNVFVDNSLKNFSALRDFSTDREIRRRLRVMVRASLRVVSPWHSGVVVTGFGSDQWFPALSHCLVDGVVGGRVRICNLEPIHIGEDKSAYIRPFAQKEMIATFMNGVHPDYRQAVEYFIDMMVELLIDYFKSDLRSAISTEHRNDLSTAMERIRSKVTLEVTNKMDEYIQVHHSDPIMKIVSLLPKEELADMAEALLSLTSLKRRVTPDDETVGVPIDVAIISKGDGLVWIKRKHYFNPDLNHRFFYRDRNVKQILGQGETS